MIGKKKSVRDAGKMFSRITLQQNPARIRTAIIFFQELGYEFTRWKLSSCSQLHVISKPKISWVYHERMTNIRDLKKILSLKPFSKDISESLYGEVSCKFKDMVFYIRH